MMEFKIGDYAFDETFIIMTKTSYTIIGLAFLRKHSAILDTAQGTNQVPENTNHLSFNRSHAEVQPEANNHQDRGKHTILAQATRISHASVTVNNDHLKTGTVQPLPQFDETAKLIVVPAITTARDKRVAKKNSQNSGLPLHNQPTHQTGRTTNTGTRRNEIDTASIHSSTQSSHRT